MQTKDKGNFQYHGNFHQLTVIREPPKEMKYTYHLHSYIHHSCIYLPSSPFYSCLYKFHTYVLCNAHIWLPIVHSRLNKISETSQGTRQGHSVHKANDPLLLTFPTFFFIFACLGKIVSWRKQPLIFKLGIHISVILFMHSCNFSLNYIFCVWINASCIS